MKKIIPFILFVLFLHPLYADEHPILAVPSINGKNVSEATASTSRNIIEAALIKTNHFNVLSYTDVEEILNAQAFSLSGCTDDSCAIEIGELLAAEKIVMGEISTLGDGMILVIRLIDVTTGESYAAETITIESENELKDRLFEAAYSLVGLVYVKGADQAVEGKGSAYVMAPEGLTLEVFIDRISYGPAPVLVENLKPGLHIVEARSSEYSFESEINIIPREIIEITADVKKFTGNLVLTVTPPGASDYILTLNDAPVSSGLHKNLPTGVYKIAEASANWDYNGEVTVERDKTAKLEVNLSPMGGVKVYCSRLASVRIQKMGIEPIELAPNTVAYVPVGTYSIIYEHPDYEHVIEQVTIKQFDSASVRIDEVPNENFLLSQELARLKKERRALADQNASALAWGWTFLGAGIVSGAAALVCEGIIPGQLADLGTLYSAYIAETDSERATLLGDQLSSGQSTLSTIRLIRTGTAIGSAAFSAISLIPFLSAPGLGEIDGKIREIEEKLK